MSHPLEVAHWVGRATDPEDNLRCGDCGGFLSFELHDLWHNICLWNRQVFADGRETREAAFEKALQDQEQTRQARAKHQAAETEWGSL